MANFELSSRWARIEGLFHAALEQSGPERSHFLERACEDDRDLRLEVESLIEAHEAAAGFLAVGPGSGTPHRSPGEAFGGTSRFQIDRVLGAGGFGVVYRVFDNQEEAWVAAKVLRDPDGAGIYRLKQEFRSLRELDHPNLVALYELLVEGDWWFFTMELVEGVGFTQYVRSDGFDPGRARSALRQLAAAVSALHSARRLHCDLKPSNVLVTPEGHVKVLDFGLVTDIDVPPERRTSELLGTAAYAAPEATSSHLSEASDWYGVGVMLYEAMTGRLPFSGDAIDIMARKQAEDPLPPCEIDPHLPPDLDALCRSLLQRDPARRPSAREIGERLSAGNGQAAVHVSRPATHFVGRNGELQALEDAFGAATRGTVVVHVHGCSGMGKTTLVEQFIRDSRQRVGPSLLVLSGRCYESESVPYKGLDGIVDDISRHLQDLAPDEAKALLPGDFAALVRLFPVLDDVSVVGGFGGRHDPSDPYALRQKGIEAFRELIDRLARGRRLVLFLDDLQWGDADSALLLTGALLSPDPPPVLVLGCHRSDDEGTSPFLQAFISRIDVSADVRRIEIGSLSPGEARLLASGLLAGASPDASTIAAEQIARESGGNPMFVDLLAHYVGGEDHSLPITIEDVILARASQLSEETRRLLEIVAVVGQPVDRSVAERAAGLSDPGRSLETLRKDRLVRLRPQGARQDIEVYHDRIRESVRSTLDPERLRSHQGRLAAALETTGMGDPETLAVLWRAAGEAARAATFAGRAAENAMSTLAFDRAARLYRMALELQAEGSAEVGRLRLRLAEALANAGLGSEAADVYLALAESTRGGEALDIRGRAAEQLLKSARVKEGLAMAAVVLKELRVRLPGTTAPDLVSALWRRAWIRLGGFRFREREEQRVSHNTLAAIDTCWSLTLGLSFTDPLRGWALQAQHLSLALKAGEPYRVARALAVEAGHEATLGTRAGPRTRRLLNRTTELARRTARPHAEAVALMAAGFAAYFEGLWKHALAFFERSASILRERCTGVAWELNTCHVYGLKCLFYSGAWREVASRLPVLLKDAQDRGDRLLEQGLVEGFFYFSCLTDDEPDHARKRIRRGLDGTALRELRIENFWLVAAEVEVGLYCGDGAGNLTLLGDLWPDLERSQTRRVQQNRILACWLRSRSALGRVATGYATEAEKRALLERAEADARRIRAECSRWGTALASLVDAGLQACRGHRRETLLALDEAEASLEGAQMGGLIAAVVRRRRGEVLGGVEGSAQQEQADAWLKSQGIRRPDRIADVYLPGNFSGVS